MTITNKDPHSNLPAEAVPKVDIKDMDPEFQRFITNSDVLKIAFFKKYCGWIEYQEITKKKYLGDETEEIKTSYKIDWDSRVMNEAGASFLYASIFPLVSPLVQTSKLSQDEIYHLWDGITLSLKYTLLRSISVGRKVWARDKDGNLLKKSITVITGYRVKKRKIKGQSNYKVQGKKSLLVWFPKDITKIKTEETEVEYQEPITKTKMQPYEIRVMNPYQMEKSNVPDSVAHLFSLYAITCKAKDGWTLNQLAQSFVTSNIIRSGGIPVPQENNGIFQKVTKFFPGGNK